MKVFGEKKYEVSLHFGLEAVLSILGKEERLFVTSFHSRMVYQ
jgi:hypothetical protein